MSSRSRSRKVFDRFFLFCSSPPKRNSSAKPIFSNSLLKLLTNLRKTRAAQKKQKRWTLTNHGAAKRRCPCCRRRCQRFDRRRRRSRFRSCCTPRRWLSATPRRQQLRLPRGHTQLRGGAFLEPKSGERERKRRVSLSVLSLFLFRLVTMKQFTPCFSFLSTWESNAIRPRRCFQDTQQKKQN